MSTTLIVDAHLSAPDVDRDPADLHDLRRRCAIDATEDSLDARDELGGRERLREVVVGAELEPEHTVDLAVAGGEEDHRHLRRASDAPADLEPVDVGETDVEHHEPRPVRLERPRARAPGRALQDAEPLALEVEADEIGDVGLVVDDDDRALARPWRPLWSGRASVVEGAVGRMTSPSQRALGFTVRSLGLAVDADDAELHPVAERPLEVVHERPVEVAADVEPVVDGPRDAGERVTEVRDPSLVVRRCRSRSRSRTPGRR